MPSSSLNRALDMGRHYLASIDAYNAELQRLKTLLSDYRHIPNQPDDVYCWLTCVLALTSVSVGNFGVGSILIDPDGNVVAHGHNEVFRPHFRSDLHAEMVVMNRFEDSHPQLNDVGTYTLYTSLEPCPMCLVRLIGSGLKTILYAAPDRNGGMTLQLNSLPSLWVELSQGKTFAQARCSEALQAASLEIFLLNIETLADAVKKRS